MDDQWNMWTKVGVRKLVWLDGETTTMSEHESGIVMSQHRSPACATVSTSSWQQPTEDRRSIVAIASQFPSAAHALPHTPAMGSWNQQYNKMLSLCGSNVLDHLAVAEQRSNLPAIINTPVSNIRTLHRTSVAIFALYTNPSMQNLTR
jgi:hypothetical protein